jgi:hypothetical protein
VQELREATFDLLSFGLWSGEPEQDVVGLCRVAGYAELGSGSVVFAGFGG